MQHWNFWNAGWSACLGFFKDTDTILDWTELTSATDLVFAPLRSTQSRSLDWERVGTAQLVKHRIKKQSWAQKWLGINSLMQSGIFSPESTFSADYVMVFVQPLCAIACINICVHTENPKPWQPYHCLDTQGNTTHTGRKGQRCSCGCCMLNQRKQPKFPQWLNEVFCFL